MYYAQLLRRSLSLTTAIAPFPADVCFALALVAPPTLCCANAVRALLHADVLVQPAWFRQLKQPEENSILLQAFLTAGAS